MRRPSPASSSDARGDEGYRSGPASVLALLRPPGWLRQNLEQSLPILLAGAVCVVLAAWLDLGHAHPLGAHASFLFLLAAVGATLEGGGIALTLVEERGGLPGLPSDSDFVLVPRADWERWQEEKPEEFEAEVPGTPSAWPAAEEPPTTTAAATPRPPPRLPTQDVKLVAEASAALLRSQAGSGSTTPPGGARVAGEGTRTPAAGAAPGGGVPAGPRGSRPPAGPAPPPIWQEDPMQELESVLAELARDRAGLASSAGPLGVGGALDRCAGCGAAVTAYSEQGCVLCGRPLCDACMEQSVTEHRSSTCSECASRPGT